MSSTCDFLVIGAGIAGASAAYELALHGAVIVLEGEDTPGYHTTGRSAALFLESYGTPAVRAVTRASRDFFENTPVGFTDTPLVSPRGTLHIARPDQVERLHAFADDMSKLGARHQMLNANEIRQRIPVMREGYASEGVLEIDAQDIDVHALHQGFLAGFRARGGKLQTSARVEAFDRRGADWEVRTASGTWTAPVVVNAAGAWAEQVGVLAGAAPVGLVPKRRTALNIELPAGFSPETWPVVHDIDEGFYFKPDAGRLLISPEDETPHEPCDIQADELDVAIAVDRFEKATTLKISRIPHRWAGLRSFVADKTLVAGFDDQRDGFFWLTGQGGYGIQTSPAMGRIAAGLITAREIPPEIASIGLTPSDLHPQRLVRAERLSAAIIAHEQENADLTA